MQAGLCCSRFFYFACFACLAYCMGVFSGASVLPVEAQQSSMAMESSSRPAAVEPSGAIGEWFKRYDLVRYKAQMSPQERAQADGLLSRGLSVFIPGPEKAQAQSLLASLVQRYDAAGRALEILPVISQTEQLQRGYHEYFVTARQLFADYLTVQSNPLAQDASGQPLIGNLLTKKQALENFERSVKNLDTQVRQKYGVAAYSY